MAKATHLALAAAHACHTPRPVLTIHRGVAEERVRCMKHGLVVVVVVAVSAASAGTEAAIAFGVVQVTVGWSKLSPLMRVR